MDVTPPPVVAPPIQPPPEPKKIHPIWSAMGTSTILIVLLLVVSNIVAVPFLAVAFGRMMVEGTFPGMRVAYSFRSKDTKRIPDLQRVLDKKFAGRAAQVTIKGEKFTVELKNETVSEGSDIGEIEASLLEAKINPTSAVAWTPIGSGESLSRMLKDPLILIGSATSLQLTILLLMWASRNVYFKEERALPKFHSGSLWKAVAIGLIIGPLVWFGADALDTMLRSGLTVKDDSIWGAVAVFPGWGKVGVVLSGVLGAPILEEIFFRGMMIGVFQRYGQTWAGVLFSSVAFGLAHLQDLAVVASITIMGLVLGAVYVKTKSIYATITIHMVNNALSFAVILGLFPWSGR